MPDSTSSSNPPDLEINQARFYDGQTGTPYILNLRFTQNELIGSLPEQKIKWKLNDLVILQIPDDGREAIITSRSNPELRLLVTEGFYKKLTPFLPQRRKQTRLMVSWKRVLILSLAVSIILVLFGFVFLEFTGFFSRFIPKRWEIALGNSMIESLPHCSNRQGKSALEKLKKHFSSHTSSLDHQDFPDPLTLHIQRNEEINAYALPGNHIVFNSGLLHQVKTEEELAAIMAHEIAHLIKHHPRKALTRKLGLYLFFYIVFNRAADVQAIGMVTESLTESGYNRKDETEADLLAFSLLDQSQISKKGFKSFFTRMQEESAQKGLLLPSYLSTHPSHKKRLENLKQNNPLQKTSHTTLPFFSKTEWEAIKQGCKSYGLTVKTSE